MSELKKCPFCNGNRIEIRKNGLGWYIGCSDCLMGFSTLKNPKEYWNTRPIEDALLARAEKAEAEVERLKAAWLEDEQIQPDGSLRPSTRAEAAEKRVAELEQVIRGMFPLWIAAMSYGEHGRAADLDRIRNYRKRDSILTADDLRLMFSLIPEKIKK